MGDIADWDTDRLYDVEDDFHVSDEPYEFSFIEVLKESEKAWLIVFEDWETHWLPKSECALSKKEKLITVPRWLVLEKEMEHLAK